MRDFLVLADVSLRSRLRSPAAAALALLVLAALAFLAFGKARGAGGAAASAFESTLLLAGVVAALVAAGSGADHPAARAAGTAEWGSTLAASAPARRTAPALSGIAAATSAGLAVVGLGALALATFGAEVPTAASRAIALPERTRATARPDAPPAVLAIPVTGAADVLELDVRPVFRDVEAAVLSTTSIEVREGDRRRTLAIPVRGTVVVPLRPEARGHTLELRGGDPRVDVVVDAARVRGGRRSFLANALVAGLLLALAAACVAPAAVLLSRWTSAPTAVLAGAVLALLGAAHGPLLELAAGAESVRGGVAAGSVLRAAASLAPDLSGASRAFDAARGRALGLDALVGLAPAAAHALAASVLLAFVPSRRGDA